MAAETLCYIKMKGNNTSRLRIGTYLKGGYRPRNGRETDRFHHHKVFLTRSKSQRQLPVLACPSAMTREESGEIPPTT